MVTGVPVNSGDFHKLRIYLLGNKALFENVFWVCEECILLCTPCFLFTLVIGRLSGFLSLAAVVCLLYVTVHLLASSCSLPTLRQVFYLYLALSGKIPRLRSKRCYFKDGGRGESWGQGHVTLLSAPPPPHLRALSFVLLLSIGIFAPSL